MRDNSTEQGLLFYPFCIGVCCSFILFKWKNISRSNPCAIHIIVNYVCWFSHALFISEHQRSELLQHPHPGTRREARPTSSRLHLWDSVTWLPVLCKLLELTALYSISLFISRQLFRYTAISDVSTGGRWASWWMVQSRRNWVSSHRMSPGEVCIFTLLGFYITFKYSLSPLLFIFCPRSVFACVQARQRKCSATWQETSWDQWWI